MPKVIGIDLGTTNSLVACLDAAGRPQIIPNGGGKRLTPSVVGLDRTGKVHVGDTALNQLQAMPERTVAEVKRLMGTPAQVELGDQRFRPQEISAMILRALKADAERFLGAEVEEAVVTVPAYFPDAARQATKDAGELAGLRVERILNEPTAAALAYGLEHLDAEAHVLVFDLGGGTLDVSVLEMFAGVLEVKAAAGNDRLGGTDFDRAIVAWLRASFHEAHGIDLTSDPRALARLKAAAEQAKIELSTLDATLVQLPFLASRGGEPLSLELELTRTHLEAMVAPLAKAALLPIEAALRDAGLARKDIQEVVLVGGASRMPLVRRMVSEYLGRDPRSGVHPDEAIALGAAIQAGLKSGEVGSRDGIMITDVSPFTLGVEVMGVTGRQPVAGLFSPIIPRNSTIPTSRTEVYATTRDGQTAVDVVVYQGESRRCMDNLFLDRYRVDGVPAAPAGIERVAVTFTYDVNGILLVNTKILSTGHEARLSIDRSPNRLDAADRRAARERLEATLAAAASPPPGEQGPAADGVRSSLVAAGRAAALSAPAGKQGRLLHLAAALETAVAEGRAPEADRLERELTTALLDQAARA